MVLYNFITYFPYLSFFPTGAGPFKIWVSSRPIKTPENILETSHSFSATEIKTQKILLLIFSLEVHNLKQNTSFEAFLKLFSLK